MLKLLCKASKRRLFLESLFYTSKGVVQTLIYVILFGSIVNALQDESSFMYIAIFTGVIAIITCIALFFQSWFTDVFLMYDNAAIQKYFTRNVYQHAVEIDIEKYDDPKFYDQYILTLEEAQNRAITLSKTVAQYIGTLITVIILLTTIISIDINILWFVALPLIPSLIIGRKKNKCYYDLYMNNLNPTRKTAYVNRVMYLSKYAKDIRLSNIFNRLINTYHQNMDKVVDNEKKYGKKGTIYTFFLDYITEGFVYIGILIYITYRVVESKTLMIGDYLIILNAVSGMGWRIHELIRTTLKFEQFSLFINNFRRFMNTQSKAGQKRVGKIPDRTETLFEFSHVDFSYDQRVNVLEDINMTIKKGEKIAIVGHNGAGKSTFVKLLLNLYEPTAGEILYNRENVHHYDQKKYRDIFSVVFQDFTLYALSVGENITTQSVKDQDISEINHALNESDMWKRIQTLPNGIQTVVTKEFDEKGFVPSGGESQKLAIARSIFKKSDVFIFDEPSSALDPLSEAKINELMLNAAADKTVIFISHRLSATLKADRIYLFEHGKISEQGTHDELVKRNEKYANMYKKQAEKYDYAL